MSIRLGPGYYFVKKPTLRKPKNKGWYTIIGLEGTKAEGFGRSSEEAVKDACCKLAKKLTRGR